MLIYSPLGAKESKSVASQILSVPPAETWDVQLIEQMPNPTFYFGPRSNMFGMTKEIKTKKR